MITLSLQNAQGETIYERTGTDATYLTDLHAYALGDQYVIKVDHAPTTIVAQLDPALAPATIYLTATEWRFTIPFDLQRESPYAPGAFTGRHHYATVRYATPADLSGRRNLAVNSHDWHDSVNGFPHASATAETRGETVFFARNAIDGLVANESHGNFPFQSWGIDQRDDAELTLDFGRSVKLDTVVLVLRADYPHDSYWTNVTISFDDGSHEDLVLEKTADPQPFPFSPRIVSSLRLTQLIKATDSSTFPALTEIQAYGELA